MKSLSLSKPHMIVMVGIPGSGKSFFAEKFAETFRAPFVSQAKIAMLLNGNDSPLDSLIRLQLNELLKTQQSVIVEVASDTRASRVELAKVARTAGYETLLVWVQTDPVTAKARAVKDNLVENGDDFDRRVKRFTAPNSSERFVVISGKHTYATQAKVILKKLSAPRAEISVHPAPPVRPAEPGRRNITIR